jgi:predicted O-linked N-acetylglucosamine transferase (SPINDLY family)
MLASTGSLRSDITACFQSKGIDSARINFVEPTLPADHLYRYHLIDISLDPLPYTGHTSTLDSLWMGVPVVTLSGQTSVARGSVTALTNVDLKELIALSPPQYVTVATELANDISRLAQLRQTLRSTVQASPLCDEKRFTKDLESIYRGIWQHRIVEQDAQERTEPPMNADERR